MNTKKNLSFVGAVTAGLLFGAVAATAQSTTTSPCASGQTGCETNNNNSNSSTTNDPGQPATTNGGDVGGSNNTTSPGTNNNSGGRWRHDRWWIHRRERCRRLRLRRQLGRRRLRWQQRQLSHRVNAPAGILPAGVFLLRLAGAKHDRRCYQSERRNAGCHTPRSGRRIVDRVGPRGLAGGAQADTPTSTMSTAASGGTPENPVTKYPKPPFKPQQQPWPGLASKMDPVPDHGEESYKGSGRLVGRKALITGGDSGMGRAAAIAYAREGADVAFGYLPQEESDAKDVVALIRAEGRKAVPLPGDIRDHAFCRKLVSDAVSGLGGLDILVNNAAKQHAVKHIKRSATSSSTPH